MTPQALSAPYPCATRPIDCTHGAVRSVAAHDVPGPDAHLRAVASAKGDEHGLVVGGGGLHRDGLVAVVDPQPARGVAHVLEQEVQQAGLVDDDVRELREAVPHVLDPSETLEPRRVGRVRSPETGLVDPVRLGHHPLGEPEGLEGLDGAAVHAVGPAYLQRPGGTLDDPGDDLGELRQLGCEQQAGRAGADDEDVHLLR